MAANTAAIDARQLTFAYADKPILDIAHLTVKPGSHTLICGESGCGKSTFMNLVSGVLTGYAGSLQVRGTELGALSGAARDKFRADHLAVIFQQFNLIPYLSVRDNVTLGLRLRHQKADESRLSEILQHLQIAHLAAERAVNLSHGQQQRVAAARAVMGKSPLILADEPTSALDDNNARLFLDLLFREAELHDSTVVVISHDLRHKKRFDQVIDLAKVNRAVHRKNGRVPVPSSPAGVSREQ